MFSDEQLTAFRREGFVRLPGAVPADEIRDMRQRLWALMEERGALRDDPSTWDAAWGAASSRLHAIRRGDGSPDACPVLRSALDAVFAGNDWRAKDHWGQALVTFPRADQWIVPKRPWHLDHPYIWPQSDWISGVNMFLFVADIAPGGGGTCVVRSSPQLVGRYGVVAP